MAGKLWQYYQTHESTDDAYVVSDIVPLSPQVNGTVLAVHVVDNQTVDANHYPRPTRSARF